MSEPRRLAEILPEVAAAVAAARAREGTSRLGWCVVLFMASPCEEYPDGPCVMDVIYTPGMTRAEAAAIAAAAPTWTRPHMALVSGPEMWQT